MSAAAIVVFARLPVPGAAKTRLVPALGPEGAADLYGAMLQDRLDQLAELPADVVVAHTPDDAGRALGEMLPGAPRLVPQGDGDLTARLQRVAERLFGEGAPAVLFMDSDSPTLPTAYVLEAVERLASGDVDCVVGPAQDGGYYLLGLTRPAPSLFEGIPWSTDQVLAATLDRAATAGLSVHRLPAWRDVDTPEDLEHLRAQLHHAVWPPRTAQWLRERASAVAPRDGRDLSEVPWRKESGRLVYGNAWISVAEDAVVLPDGRRSPYGVVSARRAVGVLPFVDPDTVVLVRQYRYVLGCPTWEMPTGGIHPGETREEAASRELAEEAGYRAGELVFLGSFATNKSVMDETCHLYLGRELSRAPDAGHDDTEWLHSQAHPFSDVIRMVLDGEIQDSMTVIATLRAARLLGR